MSKRTLLPAALVLVAVSAVACSAGGAAPTSSAGSGAGGGSGSAAPSVAPSAVDGIAHPTGATDIVLRLDESGGFVPPEFLAAHVPQFTLFGDGTVVFVQSTVAVPPRADNIMVSQPVRTVKLTEDQVQGLLTYAIRDGALGIAKAEYQNPLVADAPTAMFTLNADGAEKTVSVVALGMEDQEVTADTAIKVALAELGTKLRDFDGGGTTRSDPYAPAAYRGVLLEQQGLEGVQVRDWPWTDIAPADFTLPEDPNMLPQGKAALTADQVAALDIEGAESGIASGLFVRDDAGTTYSLVVRPLLPGETP